MLNYLEQFKLISASVGVQGASLGAGNGCISKRPQILKSLRCLLLHSFTANSQLVSRGGLSERP